MYACNEETDATGYTSRTRCGATAHGRGGESWRAHYEARVRVAALADLGGGAAALLLLLGLVVELQRVDLVLDVLIVVQDAYRTAGGARQMHMYKTCSSS